MCGFSGFFTSNVSINNQNEVLRRMASDISHRGPDDSGTWHDAEAGIGLAHTRLAIVDLSPAGH